MYLIQILAFIFLIRLCFESFAHNYRGLITHLEKPTAVPKLYHASNIVKSHLCLKLKSTDGPVSANQKDKLWPIRSWQTANLWPYRQEAYWVDPKRIQTEHRFVVISRRIHNSCNLLALVSTIAFKIATLLAFPISIFCNYCFYCSISHHRSLNLNFDRYILHPHCRGLMIVHCWNDLRPAYRLVHPLPEFI